MVDPDEEDRLRRHWPDRTWRPSREGNWYLNWDGYNIVVSGKLGAWTVFVENRGTGLSQAGRKAFATMAEAKLPASDALMWARRHLWGGWRRGSVSGWGRTGHADRGTRNGTASRISR